MRADLADSLRRPGLPWMWDENLDPVTGMPEALQVALCVGKEGRLEPADGEGSEGDAVGPELRLQVKGT